MELLLHCQAGPDHHRKWMIPSLERFEVPWCWMGREKVWAQSYGKSKGLFSKNRSSDSEKDQLGGTDVLASVSSTRVLTTFAERGKGNGIRQPASLLHWEPVYPVLPPCPYSLIQDWWYLKFICTNSSSPQASLSQIKQYRMWNTLSHSWFMYPVLELLRILQLPQRSHVVIDPPQTWGSPHQRRRGSIFRSMKTWGKVA